MKLSKKIMALLVAGTMSVSTFAFAACDQLPDDLGGLTGGNNTGDTNNPGNNNQTPGDNNDPSNPSNPSNPGDKDPSNPSNPGDKDPSNPSNPGNPGTPDTSTISPEAAALVYKLQQLSFSGLEMGVEYDSKGKESFTAKETIVADLKNGNVNVVATEDGETHRLYIRDWNLLSEQTVWDSQINQSVTTGNLEYQGNLKEMASGLEIPNMGSVEQLLGGQNLVDLATGAAPMALGETLSVLTALAGAAGAVEVTDAKATVNVNLMAYNIASDANELVKGVTAKTTVEDILTSNYLKKYIMVFTEMVPVTLVQQGLASVKDLKLGDIIYPASQGQMPEEMVELFNKVDLSKLAAIQPDANSTTYDYILKILGSTELVDVLKTTINDIMVAQGVKPAPTAEEDDVAKGPDFEAILASITSLTKIPVGIALEFGVPSEQLEGILSMVKTTVGGLIAEEGGMLTKTSLTVPIGGGGYGSNEGEEGDHYGENGGENYEENYDQVGKAAKASVEYMMYLTVSNAKIEYTLSGGKVTGVSANAGYAVNTIYSDDTKPETVTGGVNATLTFNDNVTISDISSKNVVKTVVKFNPDDKAALMMEEDKPATIGWNVKPALDDKGNLLGVYVLDENGEILNRGNLGAFEFEGAKVNVTHGVKDAYLYVWLDAEMEIPDSGDVMHEWVGDAEIKGDLKTYYGTVAELLAGNLPEVKEVQVEK